MVLLHQLPDSGLLSFTTLYPSAPMDDGCGTCAFVAVNRVSTTEHPSSSVEILKIAHAPATRNWSSESVWKARESQGGSSRSISISRSTSEGYADPSFFTAIRTRKSISMWRWMHEEGTPAPNRNKTMSRTNSELPGRSLGDKPDITSIAESLASVPLSNLLDVDSVSDYMEQFELCYRAIGDQEDESRAILTHLLDLAGKLRKHASVVSSAHPVGTKMMEWCDQISKLSYKWTTFQLLLTSSTEHADGNGTSLRDKWDAFEGSDWRRMLESYIRKGAMRSVMILWSRYLNEDIVRSICKLLQFLPSSLPIAVYEKWIQREVIPAIVKLTDSPGDPKQDTPSLLLDFAQWLLQRAQGAAERGDVATAIQLCGLLKSADRQHTGNNDAFSYFEFKMQASDTPHWRQTLHPGQLEQHEAKRLDAFSSLEKLGETLQHIEYLAGNHHFKISLHLFADETPSTIAMSMLDRVSSPDLLREEIDNHVKKYLHFCDSHVDPVLRDYVAELAESIQTPQSTEEARALVVLDAIDDVEIRADAALVLLRSLLPPYSQDLKRFARKGAMSWDTKRREEIEEHFRLMEIQDMLMAYGIKQFNIADSRNASRLLGHILAQISRPSALEDAMRLVDAYSHLRCDRAVVQYIENLLTFPHRSDSKAIAADFGTEVSSRTEKAVSALGHVRKRTDIGSNSMVLISLMEEVVELGLTLLEMEEQQKDAGATLATFNPRGRDEMRILDDDEEELSSFVLSMVASLAAAFLPEVQSLQDYAASTRNESVLSYVANPDFILSEGLVGDLQKLKRIEAEHKLLLSVSTLRDPDKIEMKVKQLMKPDILFADDDTPIKDGVRQHLMRAETIPAIPRGKGKKRAAAWFAEETLSGVGDAKKVCNSQRSAGKPAAEVSYNGKQQDERQAQYISDLNRLASSIGISPTRYRSIVAQCAAQNGSILRAVRYSRDLFSRRCGINAHGYPQARAREVPATGSVSAENVESKSESAQTLKSISLAISWFTAAHVDEVYSLAKLQNQPQTPSQITRMQAPMYSLELLRYSVCVCDMDSFEETFVLLKNASLLNAVLHFTQLDVTGKDKGQDELAQWRLYSRWFRGDACVLPSSDTMRLATRFAIAEHKNLVNPEARSDSIASKRFVSFLVENDSDLLSLEVLLSMRVLPEDAAGVVQAQVGKLLSTVFQSQEIDNHLALGYVADCSHLLVNDPNAATLCCIFSDRLMLTLEQVDAFNAFKRQISRENVAKDFNRFQQLALIGSDAARAWQQIAFLHQCVELEGNARWWHYLNLLGIECDHKAFQSERRDLSHIRRLVPALIVKSNYDFYTVLEFTRHYQIEDNYPSLVYVEALLLNKSEPPDDLEYQDKIVGVLEDIHEQHLVALLLKSISKMSGVDYNRLLFVFRVLLENTAYPDKEEVERRIEVLHILKSHCAIEARKAASTGGSGDTNVRAALPDLISFHELIAKPRERLAELLTKDNFGVLFDLAGPLRLQTDELQMLLLKNMVQTYLRPTVSERASASVDTEAAPPFEVFYDILSRLTDTENKVTAGEWLAENFPFGEEKLKALAFALESAKSDNREEDEQKEGENVGRRTFTGMEALARLETKILRLKVELVLQKAIVEERSMQDPTTSKEKKRDILQLVPQPKELFFELYRRYSLPAYENNSETLHAVADSIAALLRISANKLRRELVNEWLVKDAVLRIGTSDVEECVFETLEDENMQRSDDEFIKRLVYVAVKCVQDSPSSGEELFEFLVRFAKEVKPRAGVTFRAKLRALRVVLRLAQVYQPIVANVLLTKYQLASSDGFFKEILDYARHCSHMVVFEEHRVPYDIGFLLKSNKDSLVRSLLRQYSVLTPWVLRCASRLMLDFDVESAELWETVLSSMRKLKMVRSLSRILEPLSRKSFVRGLETGSQIWEYVLLQPLLTLKHFQSQRSMQVSAVDGGFHDFFPSDPARPDASVKDVAAEEVLFGGFPVRSVRLALDHMVVLLQKCPFLDQIDVTAFVIHLRDLRSIAEEESKGECILASLDFYGFAVRCAMVIPKPLTRFEALMRIIQAGAYMPVLRELLDTSCFLNREHDESVVSDGDETEFAEQFRLVQGVFEEAMKRDGYRDLLRTPFEQGFVEFLAATGKIDRLVAVL